MPHINIEIKARCKNPGRIKKILKSQNADFKGIDYQVDTYFKVPYGRLKLREGNIENYLIFYERKDSVRPKKSSVSLFENKKGSSLKGILDNALGKLIVVDKKREIYFIENVKFHLDKVKDLGTFVEIEAIDRDNSIGRQRLYRQCEYYMKLLNIMPEDLISSSYSDLLLDKQS